MKHSYCKNLTSKKNCFIQEQSAISLQLHHHRSEHWVITKGIALVTNNDKEYELNEGESTFIPKKQNIGLKILEKMTLKS